MSHCLISATSWKSEEEPNIELWLADLLSSMEAQRQRVIRLKFFIHMATID